MEFKHFVQLIAIGLQARIPMHMTGFPGVGKTEFAKSLETGFSRAGIKCKVMILIGSIREPQDFGGFPVSTPDGDVIKESIGAFPRLVLAEGDYHLIARNEGRIYQRDFKVINGVDGEVELLARGGDPTPPSAAVVHPGARLPASAR